MRDPIHVIRRFVEDQRGATAIEYALIAGCVFFGIVASVTSMGSKIASVFPILSSAFQ